MTNPTAPPVPKLTDEWVAARRAELIAELVRRRHNTRLAIGGISVASAIAVLVVALILTVASPGTQSAFAGWSATPARASISRTAAAKAACAMGTAPAPGGGPLSRIRARKWRTVLTDVRGPFIAVVLQAAEGRASMSCLLGPAPTSSGGSHLLYRNGTLMPAPPSVANGEVKVVSSGTAVIPGASNGTFRRIEGRTGANVTGVTIILTNGKDVHATSSGGWFLAWWPSSAKAVSIEVATASGRHVQQPA